MTIEISNFLERAEKRGEVKAAKQILIRLKELERIVLTIIEVNSGDKLINDD